MNNASVLPLVMLDVEGRDEIEGATRFQKLVFLVQKETPQREIFHYDADKFGPFSAQLAHTLDRLEERGYIEKRTSSTRTGKEKYIFEITEKGHDVVSNLKEMGGHYIEGLERNSTDIKTKYNDQPLERLLRYVYANYEGYTTESELEL